MSDQARIANRIRRKGRGAVFTPRDFLDLASRSAVDQALSRLARDGSIRRLDRGLYDFPIISDRVGPRSPDPDAAVKAVAKNLGTRVQRAGPAAAHALGLSDQVPARPVYLTDGPTRTVRAGNRIVKMKRVAPSRLVGAGSISGDFLQAVLFLGKNAIDASTVVSLRNRLSKDALRKLNNDAPAFPDWVRTLALTLTDNPAETGTS